MVEAAWTSDTISSQKALKKIKFDLINRVEETVYVDVEAMYMGLGDQEVIESLGNYQLKPLGSKNISIDIRELGIQSAAGSSEAIIRLSIERDSGQRLTKFSQPLFYHFDDAYNNVIAYDEALLIQKYNGGLIDKDPNKAVGFRKDKTGQLVYIDKSPASAVKQASVVQADSNGDIQGNVITSQNMRIEQVHEQRTIPEI